ncbi:MAG: hypothetical protein JNK11_04620 [Alphaproteobacteria bacterium]|nr:hypothetical protein [Alphaproteobacteria bacterium]
MAAPSPDNTDVTDASRRGAYLGPLLSLEQVDASEAGAPALSAIDLALAEGGLVGIAGKPGAGHVALAAILSGTLAAAAGRVVVAGSALRPEARAAAACGLRRVDPAMLPAGRTGLDAAVALSRPAGGWLGKLLGGGPDEAQLRRSVTALARRLGWESWLAPPFDPREPNRAWLLASLAAAAGGGRVLVLLRPATPSPRTFVAGLRSLAALGPATIVLVEDSPAPLARLCDRLVLLAAGRKVADDTPVAVLASDLGKSILDGVAPPGPEGAARASAEPPAAAEPSAAPAAVPSPASTGAQAAVTPPSAKSP